ncbi:hypothetical protein H072_11604 [Dactylellina haptotyla CBS 200.50]|uniref:Fucose-specific lectin n=1 Tax=Dactylellina haptotyla (strain CBS 200.50) TaxID=1284197 RepID=S8A211_DACHA|nr:hypothetical protein H072_11604 [Dactylellina haptotyla CBS 200.50]
MRGWAVWSLYVLGGLVKETKALPQASNKRDLVVRQSSSTTFPDSDYPFTIRATLVSSGGSWVKFFFATGLEGNSSLYMGTWEKANPNVYTYEKILTDNINYDTPSLTAIMWDNNNPTHAELAWDHANKQARVYFMARQSESEVWELAYSGGVWQTSAIGDLGQFSIDPNQGMSVIAWHTTGRTNLRLYATPTDETGVHEFAYGPFGTGGAYQWVAGGQIGGNYTFGTPVAFLNTAPYTSSTPNIRGWHGVDNTNFQNSRWASGSSGWQYSDTGIASTEIGPSGFFAPYVTGVDSLSPAITLHWCDETSNLIYKAPVSLSGVIGTSSTVAWQSAMGFTPYTSAPGVDELGSIGWRKTGISAGAASNGDATDDVHLFAAGYTDGGNYTLLHINPLLTARTAKEVAGVHIVGYLHWLEIAF